MDATPTRMQRAIVIGASISGLLAARAASAGLKQRQQPFGRNGRSANGRFQFSARRNAAINLSRVNGYSSRTRAPPCTCPSRSRRSPRRR